MNELNESKLEKVSGGYDKESANNANNRISRIINELSSVSHPKVADTISKLNDLKSYIDSDLEDVAKFYFDQIISAISDISC